MGIQLDNTVQIYNATQFYANAAQHTLTGFPQPAIEAYNAKERGSVVT